MHILVTILLVYPALIVTHELGHYFAAKWIGASVEEVCFGTGRRLCSWTARSGTVFTIRLFLVSGYTQMQPEPENCRRRAAWKTIFCRKPLRDRVFVCAAGNLANILCAAVIHAAMIVFPDLGAVYALRYAALVSLLTGVLNFIPFPKSDGRHILELVLERILERILDRIHRRNFGKMKENR